MHSYYIIPLPFRAIPLSLTLFNTVYIRTVHHYTHLKKCLPWDTSMRGAGSPVAYIISLISNLSIADSNWRGGLFHFFISERENPFSIFYFVKGVIAAARTPRQFPPPRLNIRPESVNICTLLILLIDRSQSRPQSVLFCRDNLA